MHKTTESTMKKSFMRNNIKPFPDRLPSVRGPTPERHDLELRLDLRQNPEVAAVAQQPWHGRIQQAP
jgi:hypothetical protein